MRTASCSCRRAELVLAGAPRRVYACACLECQRCTGSTFFYRAIYADTAVVAQKGETKSWRRKGTSGAWLEQTFCTNCGSVLFMRAEGLQGALDFKTVGLERVVSDRRHFLSQSGQTRETEFKSNR